MSPYSFIPKKLKLSENRVKKVFSKTFFFMFFLPLGQLYAAFYAIPLFIFHFINSESAYMGYTFAYFYPKSMLTILLFFIYYLVFFYLIECMFGSSTNQKKTNSNNEERTF